MLFLLLFMLVTPCLIGSVAALAMHYYRSRQPLPLLLPRWVSTRYESPTPAVAESAATTQAPGTGKT
jgi:hypothetical protein